jgi:hypothetical protein
MEYFSTTVPSGSEPKGRLLTRGGCGTAITHGHANATSHQRSSRGCSGLRNSTSALDRCNRICSMSGLPPLIGWLSTRHLFGYARRYRRTSNH